MVSIFDCDNEDINAAAEVSVLLLCTVSTSGQILVSVTLN